MDAHRSSDRQALYRLAIHWNLRHRCHAANFTEKVYCLTVNFKYLTMIIDCAKAKSRARWLRYGVLVVMALVVLATIALAMPGGWETANKYVEITRSFTKPLADHPRLLIIEMALESVICLIGLYRLTKLLRLFESGEFFSVRAVRHLRAFALSLLLITLAGCFMPPLELLAGRLLGIGHVSAIALDIDSNDVWTAMISAVFFVIALIMGEARKLAEDNGLIV